MIRRGLQEILRQDARFEVVGEAGDGDEAVDKARELEPDIVIMDVTLPGTGGLEATRQITASNDKVRVLAVTSDTEEESLLSLLEAGGSGFVRKTAAHEDLLDALETVMRDDVYLYPAAARILLQGFREAEQRAGGMLDRLSEQEQDVLRLVAEGFTSREVAAELDLSPHTVDSYRSRIMNKLGLAHRSEVVQYALRTGLLRAERDAESTSAPP